jgi:hypothetical protein
MPLTFNGIFSRRLKVEFKQALKAALAHSTISNQVLIHLPFHHPFVKPYKLVSLFYRIVSDNKIMVTISTAVTLLTILPTPFLYPSHGANRACQARFSSEKNSQLKRLSIDYLYILHHKEFQPILPTIFDQYVKTNVQ